MGELLAIGSAFAWALTSVAMRPIVGRALWRSSLLRMLVCAGLLGIYAWPSGALSRALEAPSGAWLWLLGSTLCSMAIGDSLYFLAVDDSNQSLWKTNVRFLSTQCSPRRSAQRWPAF